MPFTFYNPPTLTPEQTNPWNAALSQAFKTYGKGVQAAYAPKMLQADIFSKQFAPLAQIASNPVAMAMMGDQGKGIMDMISRLLPQNGSQGGMIGGNNPAAVNNTTNNGAVDNTNTGNNVENNGTNPALPGAGKGFGSVASGQAQGRYYKSPTQEHLYSDPAGNEYSSSAGDVISQAQKQENAISNFDTFVPDLIKNSKEFLQPGANLELARSHVGAITKRMGLPEEYNKIISKDPDMAGRYTTLTGKIQRIANILKAVFPTPEAQKALDQHIGMLELQPTDTEKSYTDRVKEVQKELHDMMPTIEKAMGAKGGYSLNKNNQQKPSSKKEGGFNPLKILDYKFNSPQEFQASLQTLDRKSQIQVMDEMKKRGWLKRGATR